MSDIDALYNAYNELMDAGEKAPEHPDAYLTIISGSRGSDKAKQLTSRFIPAFFKYFPDLHSKAIDGFFDLCEDESPPIRQAAIKLLPSLCKDGAQHTIKIADVLCQLLQFGRDIRSIWEQKAEHHGSIVLEVLAVIFRQGVKGTELRERSLDFITNNVIAAKEALFKDPEIEVFFIVEMSKAIGSVSDEEFVIFAKIIMQSGPYKSGKLDLTSLLEAYIAHITSDNAFDPANEESIKRVLSTGKYSMPLFKRTISADPLLKFFAHNILPVTEFRKIDSRKKVPLLRLYSDAITTGFPSAQVVQEATTLITGLLTESVPENEKEANIDMKLAECLTLLLNFVAGKHPEIIEDIAVITRFRNLYRATQNVLSLLRQEKDESKKKALEEPCRNVLAVTQEYMKPRHAWTHLNITPSWTPKPAAAISLSPAKPEVVDTSKPTSKPAAKGKAGVAKTAPAKVPPKTPTTTGIKTNPKPVKANQAQQQGKNIQGGGTKRKAEQESQARAKQPKIVRRSISDSVETFPRGLSTSHYGNRNFQKSAQPQPARGHVAGHQSQVHGQGPRRLSPGSRTGTRDSKGRISFLQR
ncbi:Apoptosis inhibitor 5 [Podila epigama]|nr:Apoptosis inhibitor 5 [Podila epigama]